MGYRELIESLTELAESEGPDVLIGFRAQSAGADIVQRAIYNEFGIGVPERSFLRTTVERHRNAYLDALQAALTQLVDGDRNGSILALRRLGLRAVGDVQQQILDTETPPNSPATIARKGSSQPLIDTGQMRQSVDSVVVLDGETI